MGDWREGYKQALIEYVLTHGSPMDLEEDGRPNYYGWRSYDGSPHFHPWQEGAVSCPAFATSETIVREESFGQFQGTFHEGSDSESFIILSSVRCACGKYKGIPWGYQGNTAELIVKLLQEES